MSVTRSIPAVVLVPVFAAVLLAGCKKAETPPAPKLGDTPGTSGSVAAPASSLPPSDGTLSTAPRGAAPGTTTDSGDAAGTTQAHPQNLSKDEESSAMPKSGQANNHSTTDPVGGQK